LIIDLHLHSYYSSDGKYSIQELLNFLSPGDIAGLADHETIGGWEDFKAVALTREIVPVLAVEWFLKKCHILSYFINGISKDFLNFMADRRAVEKNCMFLVYKQLKEKYPELPVYEKILKSRPHPEDIVGLPALAEAISKNINISIVEAGDIVRAVKRNFSLAIRPIPFYENEIIEKINSWEAIPVLAHPYRNFGGKPGRQKKNDVEKKIKGLVQMGIKGIEVYSSDSNKEEEFEHLFSLCNEMGLLPIVGSDFHYCGKGLKPTELNNFNIEVIKKVKRWLMSQ